MLEAIRNRRSVRFYRNEEISESILEEVLQAGFYAPSAHAEHPWHVVIVTDADTRRGLSKMHKWTRHIATAPVVVAVMVDKRKLEQFWVEDASAFITTMLLEATNQGLGSCWIAVRGVQVDGVDVEQAVRQALDVPEYMGVLGIVTLGYAARNPGPHDNKAPQDRVHLGRFRAT